ncbi:hypothetical protein ABZP36_008100, partial [Zizania latifolia]
GGGGGKGVNLDQFFDDIEGVKDDMRGLEGLHRRLQSVHEESKTAHDACAVKSLRGRMDADVEQVLRRAKAVKAKLEALHRANAASRKLPSCSPRSSTDRTRSSVLEDTVMTKSILENKCFLLDCGADLFVWVGRVTQVEDRKAVTAAVEEFIATQNRPKTTRVTRVIQGYENHTFKSKFESWPVNSAAGNVNVEEGRRKVAALLKQQGVDVKGASKSSAPVEEEVPPLLEGDGT